MKKLTKTLSFVIIGRNEGWKLTKCFESVFNTIKHNKLTNYEVIYVDSKSTDDSIERAKKFPEIKIFQINGECNQAIGRNIGAKKSTGEIFFFIDGDMEIQSDFLPLVYNEKEGLKDDFVSGQLKNFNYNFNGEFENNSWQYKNVLKGDTVSSTTGGIFLITKELWDLVNGMNPIFKRGEDLDFSLRLSKHGIKILRKKEIIAYHHTISYNHSDRMWKTLFSGDILYAKSLLYRKHLLNKYMYKKMIGTDYSLIVLFFVTILGLIFNKVSLFGIYLIVILFRAFKGKNSVITKLQLLLYFPIRDSITLLGFFFFYPKKNFEINYKEVI